MHQGASLKKEVGKNFDAEIKEKKNDSKIGCHRRRGWPSSRGRDGCSQTPVRVLSRPERTLHTDQLNILYFVMAVRTSRLCEGGGEIFRIPTLCRTRALSIETSRPPWTLRFNWKYLVKRQVGQFLNRAVAVAI